MKLFRIIAIVAAAAFVTPANAQWQTPNHSVPIGQGGGNIGFNSAAPGTAGLPLVSNGATSDPTFQRVPNAGIVPGAAATVKCSTGSPIAVADCAAATFLSGQSFAPALGPTPFFDVTSNAAGCTAALANAGGTDNAAAFQCKIDYLNATFGGGLIYLPAGNFGIFSTITLKGAVRFIGAGRYATSITTYGGTIPGNFIAIDTDATCKYCGFDNVFVVGSQSASATTPAVRVVSNVPVTFSNCNIWGGATALSNAGTDGLVFNCDIMPTNNSGAVGVTSTGANWYIRVKMDTIYTNFAAFVQNASGLGIAENHFVICDYSGPYTNSILIDDPAGVSVFNGGVTSANIIITRARATLFSQIEFGGIVNATSAGPVSIIGSWGVNSSLTMTGTAARSCSGNPNVSC